MLPDILDVAHKIGLPLHPIQGGRQYETSCWACHENGLTPDTNKHGHLTINPIKQVFRCPRCGYAGNVWIMARDLLGESRGNELIKNMSNTSVAFMRRPYMRTDIKEKPALDINTRNAVYTALLKKLIVSPFHRQDLLTRGLCEEAIEINEYRTTPNKTSATGIANLLLKDGYPLEGVPGFYQNNEGQWTFMSLPGLLIPIRDAERKIQAFQIRVDPRYLEYVNKRNSDNKLRKYMWMSSVAKTKGCTSGSPVHIANPYNLSFDQVGITEGPIKADIAARYTGLPFLGIAGTGLYKQAAEASQALGVKTPLVFYDADKFDNPHVMKNQEELLRELSKRGLKGKSYSWDESIGKGIDDLLVAVSKGEFPVEKTLLNSVLTIEKEDVDITITTTIKAVVSPRLKKSLQQK